MLTRLFLLFTVVPLLELAILVRLGQTLGFTPTIGLVLGTGAVGALLARREGLRSWGAVRRELEEGRVPGQELFHALLVVLSGAFLVTPGVLTDVAGLGLLVRPVRAKVIERIRRHLEERARADGLEVLVGGPGAPGGGGRPGPGPRSGKGEEEDREGEGRVIDV